MFSKRSRGMSLVFVFLIAAVPGLMAQTLSDAGWTSAAGDWNVSGGILQQRDEREPLARIDHNVAHHGVYEVEFTVSYQGGIEVEDSDAAFPELHGGFGVHVGAENAPVGRRAWGFGQSYLLWVNVDTREGTSPQHTGLRAQVYESNSNIDMELIGSVDLGEFFGVTPADLAPHLDAELPVRLRLNNRTGRVQVFDPTQPRTYYEGYLPAGTLAGDYVALRTNGVAMNFSNVSVSSR